MQIFHFFRILLIFILSCSFGIMGSFAAIDHATYKKNADMYCDGPAPDGLGTNPGYSSLVPKVDYPELSTGAINTTILQYRNRLANTTSPEERARIVRDMDFSRIGNFTGFKTLEVARVQYRTQMDRVFACSVAVSRIRTIDTLKNIIGSKMPGKTTEITKQLEGIAKKLNATVSSLKCNNTTTGSAGIEQDITLYLQHSSLRNYCHYRHYLNYLDDNLRSDLSMIQDIEKGVGSGDGTRVPQTIQEWSTQSRSMQAQLTTEINRANSVLPKALVTFSEMDRTYGMHIVLTLIYDDYVRLRNTLSKYMNASTQLYQKAYNAQAK